MSDSPGARIQRDVHRESAISLIVDGTTITAYPGESVAAALLAAGIRATRRSSLLAEPRGFFCGMGVCWECAVRIDGGRPRRGCMVRVRDGMRVDTGDIGGPRA